MPCFTPLDAWRAPGGTITLDRTQGWSDRYLQLRCGQCVGCRIQWGADWAMRCTHEAQMHSTNAFITLTYEDRFLPPNAGLQHRDWQLFAKRVRKALGPFRFFMCGEYGDVNRRPHYHASIFGLDFRPWAYEFKPGSWLSQPLAELWGLGQVSVAEHNYTTAAYISRYVMKKLTGERAQEYGDKRPPYVRMSLKPGIGATWLERFHTDVYPSDYLYVEGRKHRVPRYYDKALSENQLSALKAERIQKAQNKKEDLTPERLRTRERVKLAEIIRRQRDL